MKRKISIKSLRKKAWDLQSRFKRQEQADEFDIVRCYTCNAAKHWKEMQLGHYIHGDCMDFVDDDLRVQCQQCNKWKHGNSAIFGIRLCDEIGEERFKALEPLSKQLHKYTKDELEAIIEKYKEVE